VVLYNVYTMGCAVSAHDALTLGWTVQGILLLMCALIAVRVGRA